MKRLHLLNQLKQLQQRLTRYLKGVKKIMKKCVIDLIFSIEELELKIECLNKSKADRKDALSALHQTLEYFKQQAFYNHVKIDHHLLERLFKLVLIALGKRTSGALQTYLLETFGYKSIKFLDNDNIWWSCHDLQLKIREF